jgi:hypothetical protein
MKQVYLMLLFISFFSCSTPNRIAERFTGEDKQVFDLIERLKKNPDDKQAASDLPVIYKQAADLRRSLTAEARNSLAPGDRYMDVANQLEVMRRMYDQIKSTPAAYKVIPDPWDPSNAIARAKNSAADEYYEQGLSFLNYNNRAYASRAYDMFAKANNAVPGFKDVNTLMATAEDLATIKVVVKPVNYNNYGFNYWGFQNDFLQSQMVRDLNASSFRNVRFFSDWEARSRQIQVDKVVELNFVSLYIGQVYSRNNSYNRTAQVQVGQTKSNPPQPIYNTVTATVFVTTRVMESNSSLECRIYEWPTGNNILFDRFPGYYNWTSRTATFRGDRRALTNEDWALISNSNLPGQMPGRTDIATRLINESYGLLLSRIRSGVQFY